jgi:hypothetical protein
MAPAIRASAERARRAREEADKLACGCDTHPTVALADSRRSYTAETAKGAVLAAKAWITDGNHTATHLRV